MNKKVNINASIPVRTITPPIYGQLYGIEMSVGNIFKCICSKALVDEILSDGSTIRLNMSNYNKNNDPSVESVVEEKTDAANVNLEGVKENLANAVGLDVKDGGDVKDATPETIKPAEPAIAAEETVVAPKEEETSEDKKEEVIDAEKVVAPSVEDTKEEVAESVDTPSDGEGSGLTAGGTSSHAEGRPSVEDKKEEVKTATDTQKKTNTNKKKK